MRKYVIFGAQGSGKGTQAKMLWDLDIVHISVGDLFRWSIQNHTKIGAEVKRIVESGRLVPDEIVERIVRWRLDIHDWNYGFIIDGFPRNESQALFFLETYEIDAVINLDVPNDVVIERIMGRRLCTGCGLDYNLIFSRPEDPDKCDVCGGELVHRADDTPESIGRRLHDFNTKTMPVLDLFANKTVVEVDGTQQPDEIQAELRQKLDLPPYPGPGRPSPELP